LTQAPARPLKRSKPCTRALVSGLLTTRRMDRIKRFLIVVWVAGCGGGGGGGSGMDPDAPSNPPNDSNPGNGSDAGVDASVDASQNPIDGGGGGPLPAANDLCANATTISLANMHAQLTANPVAGHAELTAPCGTAGQPDVFFKFELSRRELVYADTFGASGNTTLYFASSCSTARTAPTTAGDAVCSTAACGTGQSQVVALLDPGTHYLVMSGQAAADIHFQHVEVGNGTVAGLAQGTNTVTGTTSASGFGTLYACDGGGAENSYWWRTCPNDAGGTFQGSTCGSGTTFDTILSFQMPGSEAVMCDDDTCSFQSTVSTTIPAGAGLFVISVDGFSSAKHGDYTLSATRP
jgi:hypothetical protein